MRVRILSRTTGAAAADGPSHTLFYWLISAFLLTLLPHVAQLPSWLTVSILVAIVVRCIAEWRRWPLPTTSSTGVVAVCLLGGIFLQFHTVLGRDAGTPFMAGLLTIKFYEWRGPRDITLIIFSSFFVVMSALLFSQAIELFVYCLIMMWLLTGILLRTYMGDRENQSLLRMLRASSILFLQALPLALLVFFFLPRYAGRFQLRLNDTVTGISDRVEPGSIAELANDDSARHARELQGLHVDPDGLEHVLARDRALEFRRPGVDAGRLQVHRAFRKLPQTLHDGDVIPQQIVLYPQNQRWVPALDRPIDPARDPNRGDVWSEQLVGNVLVAPRGEQVDYKRRYTVISTSLPVDRPLSGQERALATELPKDTRSAHQGPGRFALSGESRYQRVHPRGPALVSFPEFQAEHRARPAWDGSGAGIPLSLKEGFLRALCLGLRRVDALGKHPGPDGRGLSRRRREFVRELLHGQPVQRARLGRSLGR